MADPVEVMARALRPVTAAAGSAIIPEIAADAARAALSALREAGFAVVPVESGEAEFELWQTDAFGEENMVAGVCGPYADVAREIHHYTAMYAADGPVRVIEVIRRPLSAAQGGDDVSE